MKVSLARCFWVEMFLLIFRIRPTRAWINLRCRSVPFCHSSSSSVGRWLSSSTSSVPASSSSELESLTLEIQHHNDLYYNSDQAVINDEAYDALVRKRKELLQQSSEGVPTPTTTPSHEELELVGAPVPTDRIQQQHRQPLLSLDNVHSTEQLLAWLERVRKRINNSKKQDDGTIVHLPLQTEPKLDGLSLNLRYERNPMDPKTLTLIWAATRGDGTKGIDVTAAVNQSCPSIPIEINCDAEREAIEIKGEAVFPYSVFQRQWKKAIDSGNETNSKPIFSNARNAAAGILMRKQTTVRSGKKSGNSTEDGVPEIEEWTNVTLSFYAYDMDTCDGATIPLQSHYDVLQTWGFTVPQPTLMTTIQIPASNTTSLHERDVKPLLEYYNALEQHRKSPGPPSESSKAAFEWGDYEMDGCVHKVLEESFRNRLGSSSRAPRWAVAHKFAPQAVVTRLQDIIIQVGRTGALTPVAVLEPVSLQNVQIQRATLHNFGHLQNMLQSPTRIQKGSQVLIQRAGDVIPQVISVVGGGGESSVANGQNTDKGGEEVDWISLETPKFCPACSSPVVREDEENSASSKDRGAVLRCGGPALKCPPRAIATLVHAVSRDALDVKGLSQAKLEQLRQAGLVVQPSDIFERCDNFTERVAALDGWGPKSAQKLVTVADSLRKKGVMFSRFLFSLNIRYVGQLSSRLIAAVYGNVESFLQDVEKASVADDEAESFLLLREENDATKGIGPAVLNALIQFSRDKNSVEAAKKLSQVVPVLDSIDYVSNPGDGLSLPFSASSVVFTGTIPGFSRGEAKEIAKRMGAKSTPTTISKSTSIVVSGEKGGKKAEQAKKLGIRIMSAAEFVKLSSGYQ